MAWDFKRDESSTFTLIPEGMHRIRVKSAEKAVSKTGKDMLVLSFDVSGYSSLIFHNIVFLPDRPEITNRNLTQFFDSFKDIPEGDFETAHWIGKVGAAQVKHEEYNGQTNAKIAYFIKADKQGCLAPWKEPERKAADGGNTAAAPAPATDSATGFVPIGADELPF